MSCFNLCFFSQTINRVSLHSHAYNFDFDRRWVSISSESKAAMRKFLYCTSLSLFLVIWLGISSGQTSMVANPSAQPISTITTWQRFLVDIQSLIPKIALDIRYYGDYNFVGRAIDGYQAPKCLLTPAAAQALVQVQMELVEQGYALKIYDCYRPQQAVDLFVIWAEDLGDRAMQDLFYPRVNKADLFDQGYIAAKSGHSRGSTVDLTIIPLQAQSTMPCRRSQVCRDNSLDMGTPFDYFDPLSQTVNGQISQQQQQNRLLLKTVMEKYGFRNLPEEWWHYTLNQEPYPETYFNFPVQ